MMNFAVTVCLIILGLHLGCCHMMLTELLQKFMQQKRYLKVEFFCCFNNTDNFLLSKSLSLTGEHVNILPFSDFSAEKLQATYHPLGVILDLNCDGSLQLLLQASNQKLFSRLHHWLLLTTKSFQYGKMLKIPLDSQVTVAQLMSDHVLLQDIYRIASGMSLTYTPPQSWQEGQKFPHPLKRDNLQGATINTAVILTSGKLSDFTDLKYRHIDTTSKATFKLLQFISNRLNFRMNVTTTSSEGYLNKDSTCYDGLVGLLQCGDNEIGTGIPWKEDYLDVIDYVAHTFKSRGAFMFLKPSLSDVSILYIRPFSTSVWLTILAFMVVLTVVRVLSQMVEDKGSTQDWLILCSDAIIDTIGIICDQGTSSEEIPDSLTSRLVLFLLLLLTVFLLTSYSAIIVSLLQTSSNAINTLPELLNSSLELGMSKAFANVTDDPTMMHIFRKKLQIQTSQEMFLSEEEGMQRIRRDLYAFHGTADAYKIISDSYLEHEKCRFKTVTLFDNDQIHLIMKKDSPYQEVIKRSALWLRETGMISWEDQCWYFQKPKCDSNSQSFVSVGIHDFYPVLVILGFGTIISIAGLLLEMFYSRQKQYNITKHQHKE